MKKISSFILVIVMLLGVIVFTTGVAFSVDDNKKNPSTNPESPGNTGSGGGVITWERHDDMCPGMNKQKTNCLLGGTEQCTAQYCN